MQYFCDSGPRAMTGLEHVPFQSHGDLHYASSVFTVTDTVWLVSGIFPSSSVLLAIISLVLLLF